MKVIRDPKHSDPNKKVFHLEERVTPGEFDRIKQSLSADPAFPPDMNIMLDGFEDVVLTSDDAERLSRVPTSHIEGHISAALESSDVATPRAPLSAGEWQELQRTLEASQEAVQAARDALSRHFRENDPLMRDIDRAVNAHQDALHRWAKDIPQSTEGTR